LIYSSPSLCMLKEMESDDDDGGSTNYDDDNINYFYYYCMLHKLLIGIAAKLYTLETSGFPGM